MERKKYTTIGRPVDPSYPTNLAVLIGFGVVFIVSFAFQLTSSGKGLPALQFGLTAGLALFVGWAYGREIDPDHPISAFASAGLVLAVHLWIAPLNLGALFVLMLASRILSQTTGLPPSTIDCCAFCGLTIWQLTTNGWVFGVVGAGAFFLDSLLPNPAKDGRYFGGGVLATILVYTFLGNPSSLTGSLPPGLLLALAITALVSIPLINQSKTIESVGDHTDKPLVPQRVRASQIFSLVSGGMLWLAGGRPGSLLGLTGVILGAAIFSLLTPQFKE